MLVTPSVALPSLIGAHVTHEEDGCEPTPASTGPAASPKSIEPNVLFASIE